MAQELTKHLDVLEQALAEFKRDVRNLVDAAEDYLPSPNSEKLKKAIREVERWY